MPERVAAVVLAGGASKRMGREKALLALPDGRCALTHVLDVAHQVAELVFVAVDNAEHAARLRHEAHIEAECLVLDRFPGAGPLGALAGVLRTVTGPALMALAVDTPLVQGRVLRMLQEVFAAGLADVVMACVDGMPQPMPAIYATSLAARAEQLLAHDRRSLRALSNESSVRVRLIGEEEVRALDPQLYSFAGANTPEEWQHVLAIAVQREAQQAALKGEP